MHVVVEALVSRKQEETSTSWGRDSHKMSCDMSEGGGVPDIL